MLSPKPSPNPTPVAPVSVVIPCWRCADTIHRAVASVAAQTWPAREVILVDDASGDGTLEALHRLAASYPAGWIRVVALARNGGPGLARNAGWDAASSPYVALLDADDAWFPEKLAHQIGWMMANPEVVLTGHRSVVWPEGAPPPALPAAVTASRVSLGQMLISNRFPTRSVVLRQDLPNRFTGGAVTEDYLLWLELVTGGAPCYILPEPLACSFRPEYSGGGVSGRLWRHERYELNALARLRRQRLLSWPLWLAASVWSLVKFGRRLVIVRLRRHEAQRSPAASPASSSSNAT